MERSLDELNKQIIMMMIRKVYDTYGNRDDLKLPYLRDYYIVCYVFLQAVEDGLMELNDVLDAVNELIQMKVNAEIKPDNPNDEFTMQSIKELTSEVIGVKLILAERHSSSVKNFEETIIKVVEGLFDYYETEADDDIDDEEDLIDEEEQFQVEDLSIVYVRIVAWNDYDEKTKLANENVLEFIRRYSDYGGFDESAFLYENIGFAIVVEIDHANHSILIYKGSDDIRMVQRSFTGEIQIDLLADFMNKLD